MEKFSQKILKNKYKEIKYPRPGQSAEEAKPEDGLTERKRAKDISRREGKRDERAGAPEPETIAEVVSDVPVINVDPGDDFPLRATMEDMAHTKAREGDDGWRASEASEFQPRRRSPDYTDRQNTAGALGRDSC